MTLCTAEIYLLSNSSYTDIKNAFVHIYSVLEGKIYGIYLDKSKEARRNTYLKEARLIVEKILKFTSSKWNVLH